VTSTEPERLLLETQSDKNAYDWSADGRFLLYRNVDPITGSDVWVLPLFGDRKPVPVVQTAASEFGARFSPDGRWIAYHSNESGRNEIYVQPFPGPGPRLQISNEGGDTAQWRGDGRELFYVGLDDRLMAAQLRVNGSRIEAGTPVPLFSKPDGP
jgi:Tol biopolymer transport system component